jgi:type I restriction-modification system DNA methylase subunit
MKKKEETNDIVQFLLPQLDQLDIPRENCKVDVTTEKSGRRRGDIWISKNRQGSKGFEKSIVALIEAKHRNSSIGDMDWREAMAHGREKAQKQGLNYYVVTNCRSDVRYYNAVNDEEVSLDGEVLTRLVSLDILGKIQTQVSGDNSSVVHKADVATTRTQQFSEAQFRATLLKLEDIYRSAGLQKGDERIDPTVGFVVLKYISEREKKERTLDPLIQTWDQLREVANGLVNKDLKAEFATMREQIWGEESDYCDNDYRDFKDLISLPPKLSNDNYKSIYRELDPYPFRGANFDLFGAIYEAMARQAQKVDFGEYYTKRHITRIIARLLLRNETTSRTLSICDPFVGTGGFLTEGYKALYDNYTIKGRMNPSVKVQLRTDTFWGFDNEKTSVARTKLNMFLVGDGHIHIYENDSLGGWNPKIDWWANRFDYIMTNPPMGDYSGDISEFSFTNEKRSELLAVEKVVAATRPGGEIAIIVNDGALEAPSRERFRVKLLQSCTIRAVVSITRFAFAPYTKEKTYAVFMQKKQESERGSFQKTPIWHFIVDYDGYANSDKRYRTKYHDDLPKLVEKFNGAVELAEKYTTEPAEFERARGEFERKVNPLEEEDGLSGWKLGFVSMSAVSADNFHNLLSEFYLRPVEVRSVTEDELGEETRKAARTLMIVAESIVGR